MSNPQPQFAFTGPTPVKGYVGYVNIQAAPDEGGIRFTVRSEGESPVTAQYVVPFEDAFRLLHETIFGLNQYDAPPEQG